MTTGREVVRLITNMAIAILVFYQIALSVSQSVLGHEINEKSILL